MLARFAPTIRTASGGLCYFFGVPDRTLYPFPFGTHVHPDGYDGLEFRGAGGYQLVPTSRTPEGAYEFVPPWTLDRFRADLEVLPSAILQAWVRLDRGAQKFTRDTPENSGNARKPPSALEQTTDLSPPQPPQTRRSHTRPAPKATATETDLPTITTRLSPDECRLFVDGFDLHERECAEAVCERMGLSVDALERGYSFCCGLPGHHERTPSATWVKTDSGYYLYKDWHKRSGEVLYTVPEIYAALASRVVKRLPKPSRMAWRLRLMVEEGMLEPEPVRMRAVPDEASELLRRYCEGFRLLIASRSCHPKTVAASAPFAKAFAARWCGIPEGSIWAVHQEAIRYDLIMFAGLHKGQALYRPGKNE